MKQLVVLGSVALGIGILTYAKAHEPLLFFILTGHISIINFTVPPLIMLAFWVLVVPISVAAYSMTNWSFWKIIEAIGTRNQRRINRRTRPFKPSRSLRPVVAIVLLQVANELPESSAPKPEMSFRRRFLALPS